MTIVDDYSRRVWVYFLKNKNEAFRKFKEWKILVENQTGNKVKKLRTCNGLEFCNREFNECCTNNGITKHRACSETPQQNRIAKRLNITILEKVRCLLNESGLPKKFWVEATSTIVYLINRSPSSVINFKTPMQLWTGRKPNIAHLKPFGYIAYVHISQGKLNPRAVKGIFIGYPFGVKGYKVWLINDRKCVISRNIVFYESANINTNLQDKEIVPKVDKFQLEVEHSPGQNSQDILEEATNQ